MAQPASDGPDDRDWIQFCTDVLRDEVERMRAESMNTARFLAALHPQPQGTTIVAVQLLRAHHGGGLAKANRTWKQLRAEDRRARFRQVSPSDPVKEGR